MSEKSEAVKTAGERLEAIEAWSKRTFIAAVASAAFLGIMATVMTYVAVDYIRLKYAAAAGIESFSREMQAKFPARPKPAPKMPF